MNKIKIIFKQLTVLVYILYLFILPFLTYQIINPPKVLAETAFHSDSLSVTTGTVLTDHTYSNLADDQRTRILATSSGLDATFTIDDVDLNSANMIYVNYDGHVSSASLTYQVQIRDFNGSTWRNLVPHDTTLANTSDSGVGLVSYSFPIYDGYFTNGSSTPVSTPISYFINGSNQVQIRFYSSASAAAMELRVDHISVEPVIETMAYPSSRVNNDGGTETNEYNDLITDDNTTNSTIAANANGIDVEYVFTGIPTPYTGANAIFVEWSGSDDANLSDYSIAIRDYSGGAGVWDTLNGTLLNSASDATHHFVTPSAQTATDYLSSGEARIRLTSADTSGTLTLDYLRITVGSTTTNAGVYVEEISRGTSSSGAIADTRTVDTTSAAANRVIASSTTDVTATTQYPNDCNGATNNCFGYNIKFPVTVPTNNQVIGVHGVARYNSSSTSNDIEWGFRVPEVGNINMNTSGDLTAANTNIRTASSPMTPQIGSLPQASRATLYEPEKYVNTIDDSVTMYFRSNAPTLSANLTVDFAFVSIRYIDNGISLTNTFTPTGATLTNGTNNASNFRYANADDANYYSITQNGTTGTDFYLSFNPVELPTGTNKIIVDARVRTAATATINYDVYLYDFNSATWRKIIPHESQIASENNTEEILQVEIYDGYFSDTSDVPISTPLSYFVSGSEMRLRFVSSNTANRIELDWVNIEVAEDPVYFPADSTITNGTRSNEYNDTTTDDAATSYTITNSGGIDFYLSYLNVITPPAGSNAIMFVISSHMTAGAGSYNISIRNFSGGGSWEVLNSGAVLSHTADRTDYFIKSVSTWSDYISGGEMRLRFNSASAGGTVVVDQAKLILGSVNTDAVSSSIDLGSNFRNTVAKSRDADTSATLDFTTHTWGIRSFPNSQSVNMQDAPSNIALTVNFPVTPPSNSYISSIIWTAKGQSNVTTISPQISFYNHKNATRPATNMKGTMTTVSALPNAVDVIIYNVASETFREGWFKENVPNLIDTTNNLLPLRIRPSASTLFGPAILNLDLLFTAVRYVN
jgi:hypothetical protein